MYPFEVVTWWDHCSCSDDSWKSLEKIQELEPTCIISAGWVVKETKTFLTIVGHLGLDGDGSPSETSCGEIAILKAVVVARKRLKKFDR